MTDSDEYIELHAASAFSFLGKARARALLGRFLPGHGARIDALGDVS